MSGGLGSSLTCHLLKILDTSPFQASVSSLLNVGKNAYPTSQALQTSQDSAYDNPSETEKYHTNMRNSY